MLAPCLCAEESHVEDVLFEIKQAKQAILTHDASTSPESYVFLAFWDFDGTLLHGDCSEGLIVDGKTLYKGFAQLAIEAGLSEIYRPDGGFDRFWKDYTHMEKTIGRWFAYPFIPQMLRGCPNEDLVKLAKKHFDQSLKKYYFQSSIRILKSLEDAGIENHIISASADVFVDAAASSLNLPTSRFNGIQVTIENGRLTEKLVYPVTWAEGKTERLKAIVAATQAKHPSKRIIVLAAFGNSFSTDGAFMKYVASQKLPAGKPVTLMINGGDTPADYLNLFKEVQQAELVSE